MRELISTNTNINFFKRSGLAFFFSFLIIAAGVYKWIETGDDKYGVDFKGGHEIIVAVDTALNSGKIRDALDKGGLNGAVVQSFESNAGQYSIRLSGDFQSSDEVKGKITSALKDSGSKLEILATNFVGPTIGSELRKNAIIAIVLGLVGMLLYITWRFEFAFAFGAVVAVFHDVLVCLSVYLWAGHTFNMGTIAAALTIVGYSVNDTIVIFDRVREEMMKRKEFELKPLINECMNITLSRTLITSLLTFLSALALLIFGGGAIRELALFMVVGLISGTYSTIYIASPSVMGWLKYCSK